MLRLLRCSTHNLCSCGTVENSRSMTLHSCQKVLNCLLSKYSTCTGVNMDRLLLIGLGHYCRTSKLNPISHAPLLETSSLVLYTRLLQLLIGARLNRKAAIHLML